MCDEAISKRLVLLVKRETASAHLPHLHCTERSAVLVWRAVPGKSASHIVPMSFGSDICGGFNKALSSLLIPLAHLLPIDIKIIILTRRPRAERSSA